MAMLADYVSSHTQYASNHQSAEDVQHVNLPQDNSHSSTPLCSVLPGLRESIPTRVLANDAAFPTARLGMAEVMGGPSGHGCVPAHERLGPFGHGAAGKSVESRPWSSLRWGSMQTACAKTHFAEKDTTAVRRLRPVPPNVDNDFQDNRLDSLRTGRTALILRTWDKYHYYGNQMAWLRALVTELSLDTGGRFEVFLMVDVKDQSLDLSNDEAYATTLERSVPEEFRDMALLWTEAFMQTWFPKVGKYTAQDQMYQALQVFSYSFPEFDYVWQLEMDARFTGNAATMLTNAGLWAQNQPRKNLWERNARWYIPDLWHNNYSTFSAAVDNEFSTGQGIWGPHRDAEHYVKPEGPMPPDNSQEDWGIGEPADLINFSPLIDPKNTDWVYEHTVHGFENPENLPRRMSIVSMTRTSRRLLRLISREQRATGAWVVSESTPETWSLLHGLKAVYLPHLVAFNFEQDTTPEGINYMVHKGPPWSLAGGPRTGFLWCGNEIKMPEPRWLQASYFYWAGDAPRTWWLYTNGTCTWPLLLHPVKDD